MIGLTGQQKSFPAAFRPAFLCLLVTLVTTPEKEPPLLWTGDAIVATCSLCRDSGRGKRRRKKKSSQRNMRLNQEDMAEKSNQSTSRWNICRLLASPCASRREQQQNQRKERNKKKEGKDRQTPVPASGSEVVCVLV